MSADLCSVLVESMVAFTITNAFLALYTTYLLYRGEESRDDGRVLLGVSVPVIGSDNREEVDD